VAAGQGQHGRGSTKSGEGTGLAEQCAAHRASRCPREGARRVHWLGEPAEGRARQWLPGGSRGSSGSDEQEGQPGQHAGVQAQEVREEGLGALRQPWT
jgi:hypothetical protein